MALKSLLARAVAAGNKAHRQGQQDGWSDGWHTQASTAESLRVLRDSTAEAAKSTAQTATTPGGWRRIARGAGKAVAGTAAVAGGIAAEAAASNSGPRVSDVPPDPYSEGWQDGPEGFGYYSGGLRVDD